MLWWVVVACLAVALIALPGHLLLDRLWALAFGPPLEALFRNRRRAVSLRVMWLDFINMCATVFVALLGGLLILPPDSPPQWQWILVGIAAVASAVVVVVVSTRDLDSRTTASRAPATPMMMAGSFVAILLGIIVILTRR